MKLTNSTVAWFMADNNIMAGTVTSDLFGRLHVKRMDGGTCTIEREKVWIASNGDITRAIQFVATIGK